MLGLRKAFMELVRRRKTKFLTVYIQRYTSSNEYFEYGYPLINPATLRLDVAFCTPIPYATSLY